MGGFYNSLHIRNKTQQEVIDGIKSLDGDHGDCIVGTESHHWVPVFAEIAYGYPLSVTLSEKLKTDVINIDIHDDDVFCYWYFCDGKEVDAFNSCPNYFDGAGMTMPDVDNLPNGDKLTELLQELTKKVKERFNISSSTTRDDFMKMISTQDDLMKIMGDMNQHLKQEIHEIVNLSSPTNEFEANETDESDANESVGNPACFSGLLNPEEIEKLAAILESMRNHSSAFVSIDAQQFYDLLGWSDELNSYEYLLEDGMPEGYIQVPDETKSA
ncbi:MAG: hypothetical protein LBU65_14085 [Planctomycetaceae bacterium]|nr:hypothetical protein [Planctomycetaceae bacterium]